MNVHAVDINWNDVIIKKINKCPKGCIALRLVNLYRPRKSKWQSADEMYSENSESSERWWRSRTRACVKRWRCWILFDRWTSAHDVAAMAIDELRHVPWRSRRKAWKPNMVLIKHVRKDEDKMMNIKEKMDGRPNGSVDEEVDEDEVEWLKFNAPWCQYADSPLKLVKSRSGWQPC